MKKIFSSFLALLMVMSALFCLTGCGVSEKDIAVAEVIVEEAIALLEELPEETAEPESPPEETMAPTEETEPWLDPYGSYTTKEDVALYIHLYGELPLNFMTKKHAKALGWEGGSLEPVAPGMCIGGDWFGNYEGLLPEDREYTECDIDTRGASKRGAKRIVFSDDGLIYYTEDHYKTFELLYGEP